jgi:hypothetical protein
VRPCDGWNDDDLDEDDETDNLVALRSSLILDPSELLRCRCRGCRCWCGCCDDAIREIVVVVVVVAPCFDFRDDDGEGDDDEHDDERGDLDCDRDTLLLLLLLMLLLLLLLLVGVVVGSSMWVTRRTREDDDDDDDGDRTRDPERDRERVDGSCCCGSFLDSFLWLRVLVTRCCCGCSCCSVASSSVGFLWRVRDLDKLRALRRSVVGNIQRSFSLLLQHTLPPLCVFCTTVRFCFVQELPLPS